MKGVGVTKGARAAIESGRRQGRAGLSRPSLHRRKRKDQQWPTQSNEPGRRPRRGDSVRPSCRSRFLFLIGGLIVYRIGTFIPVPGIDPVALARFFQDQQGTILSMFNMFSGGALERLSIFALGVMPYISASIIVQMMAVVVPQLQALRKEGESGRRKLTQYTRWGTVGLARVPGRRRGRRVPEPGRRAQPGRRSSCSSPPSTLTTGTMFLMWLGEQITERGLGNGISMIILAGIVAGLPAAIGGTLELVRNGEINPALALILVLHGRGGHRLRGVRRARASAASR